VSDRLLDHACTLLAALRLGLSPQEIEQAAANWAEPPLSCAPYRLTPSILQAMLKAAGLLDAAGPPLAQPTRSFLEADRGAALVLLAQGWLHSPDFNDLLLMPGLLAEGEWRNDPLRARQSVMDFLSSVPPATWWSLNAFVAAIRQSQPDFQRPAGDYDSWYLRLQPGAEPVKSTGKEHPAEPEPSEDQERLVEYLRGFEHWDEVDGALIRFLIQGPLHWLGFVELAAPGKDKPASAFRLSPWEPGLLAGEAPAGLPVETAKVQVSSDALLRVPGAAPRAVRYQVARFAAWEGEKNGVYTYRLTPGSLQRARLQELTVSQLLSLLRRHAALVPPNLSQALTRWEERGVEARLERVTVLRLSHPSMLRTLSSSPAARFLGDALGPTTVIVRPGAWSKVLAVLAELGYLGEVRVEDETQKKPPE
jgi:hypothetical protein